MENNYKSIILGDGAHICAAAEGGPRYDPNMTPEERRSIDNCIWMCKTHARLIDADAEHYSVEKLRSWKKAAEAEASAALANTDYFSEYYKSNQDNLAVITQLFEDMVADGQFNQLITMLKQYSTGLLSETYDEFVLRYRIIYDAYCCRSGLDADLDEYISLPCKNGIEELAKLFIAFWMRDELVKIQEYCKSKELIDLVFLTISGKLEAKLFPSTYDKPTIKISPEYSQIIAKAVVNYLRINKITWIVDQSGSPYELYKDEFFYRTVAAAYSMISSSELKNSSFEEISTDDNYTFIKENQSKIQYLDIVYQEYIWSIVLTVFATDKKHFELFYGICPDTVKDTASVKKANYINMIAMGNPSLDADEIAHFAEDNDYYEVLVMYLSKQDNKFAATYLDDRKYMLSKDSKLLFFRLIILDDLSKEKQYALLIELSDRYANDYLYHCLLANASADANEIENELEWLKQNQITGGMHNFSFYISLLHENKKWDEINNLSQCGIYYPNEYMFRLAAYLASSGIKQYYSRAKEMLEELINYRKWKPQYIYFNLGQINQQLGLVEAAKECYQREYDEYNSVSALMQLISLRIETNVFLDDIYLAQLKERNDSQAQNLVGVVYFKRKEYAEARKYFIRSLLIDDKCNPSINGLLQISLLGQKDDVPDRVQQDTVCVMQNENEICKVAIHSNGILYNLSPNHFTDCVHVSIEDPSVSQLLFCKVGDSVVYESQSYYIDSIYSVDTWFSKAALSSIMSKPDTITISGSTPEEMIDHLTEFMSTSSNDLEQKIKDYNESEIRLPLTGFSRITGKGMLVTCEFLAYQNTERIRNNLNEIHEETEHPVLVLSYDSIVYLAHLGLVLQDFRNCKLVCAPQVRNQLFNDIDEEFRTLESDSHAASMHYLEGKLGIIEYTPEIRRKRYSFLTKLKDFVTNIECPDISYDYLPNSSTYCDVFSELILHHNMLCESGTLGLAQNMENTIIVTDDQPLFSIANLDGIRSVGLLGLFAYVFSDWNSLLNLSKKLHDINYINYLPFFYYKKMVDMLISNEKDDHEGSVAIQQWIISDTDKSPSDYHEDIIICLTKEVHNSGENYLNPSNILDRCAISAFERRKPGFLQETINAVLQQMEIDIQQDNLDNEKSI